MKLSKVVLNQSLFDALGSCKQKIPSETSVFLEALDKISEEDSHQQPQSSLENTSHLPTDNGGETDRRDRACLFSYLQQGVGLRQIIESEFKKKLPVFEEYRRQGYNLNGLDRDGLSQLEGMLHLSAPATPLPGWQNIMMAAKEFLRGMTQLALPPQTTPELQAALDQANNITANIRLALEALDAAGMVKERVAKADEVVNKQLYALAEEARKTLDADTVLTVSDEGYIRTQTELMGLLRSESNDHVTENVRFKKLTNSQLAEDRVIQIRLAAYLESTSDRLLKGARHSRKYVLRYQPQELQTPVSTDESVHIPIARAILSVAPALEEVAATLRKQAADILSAQEESPGDNKDLWEEVVAYLKNATKKMDTKKQMYVNVARSLTTTFQTAAWKVLSASGQLPVIRSAGVKRAVKDTGLLLLDELHQIKRRLKLLPAAAQELQEGVEQRQSLITPATTFSALPVLDSLLDAHLEPEAARWDVKIKQSEEKLEALLAPVTRFVKEKRGEEFWYVLSAELRKEKGDKGEWKGVKQFDEMMTGAISEFSSMAAEVEASALRLAGHRHAGGKDLIKKVQQWLCDLALLEKMTGKVMAKVTGESLDYYSRGGMLARGVAEWAEALKQDYLREMKPEDPEAAAVRFGQSLMSVVQEHSGSFGKKSDPEAEGFLRRLALELKHAEQNTTTYPPTPEEILAGSRGLQDDIKHWAQRKVVSGAISAAIMQGFRLVSSPVYMSGGMAWLVARGGLTIYMGIKDINRGVRVGQGPATREIKKFVKRKAAGQAFRLIMSSSPLGSWTIAAGMTSGRINLEKGYARTFVIESLSDLPEDLLWRGVYGAVSETLCAAVAQLKGAPGAEKDEEGLYSSMHDSEDNNKQKRRKRNVNVNQKSTGDQDISLHDEASMKIKMLISYPSFRSLSEDVKKATYLNAIRYKLFKIEQDSSLPAAIRHDAYLARIGAPLLVPIFINKAPVKNVFFLPDNPGGKCGMIISLDSSTEPYYINKPSELDCEIKAKLPLDAKYNLKLYLGDIYDYGDFSLNSYFGTGARYNIMKPTSIFDEIKNGSEYFGWEKFNYYAPKEMNLSSLADLLYKYSNENSYLEEGRYSESFFLKNAILGFKMPQPDVSVTPVKYELALTWENLSLEEYLKSIANPFSKLGGQVQLIISDIEGDSIQDTIVRVDDAEYIGKWIDVSIGTVVSFTPQGIVLTRLQQAADIGAEFAAGRKPNPLILTAFIMDCIPGEKIAANIGKFSRVAGESVGVIIRIKGKIINLAVLGETIKVAIETGEPLVIYQTLIQSGLSAKNAYEMAGRMSQKLKINKSIMESADLKSLDSFQNESSGYDTLGQGVTRNFKFGQKEMLGRINNNKIEVSVDGGKTWTSGSSVHLLAYRLQNAGGGNHLPENSNKQEEYLSHETTAEREQHIRVQPPQLVNARVYNGPVVYSRPEVKNIVPKTTERKAPAEIKSLADQVNPSSDEIINAEKPGPSGYRRDPQSLTSSEEKTHDIESLPYIEEKLKKELYYKLFSESNQRTIIIEYFNHPENRCYDATVEAFCVLRDAGYKPKVIGVLLLSNSPNKPNINHNVIYVEKGGEQMIVDITIRQFNERLNEEHVILKKDVWMKTFLGFDEVNRVNVFYKTYDNPNLANKEIGNIFSNTDYYDLAMLKNGDFSIINIKDSFLNKVSVDFQSKSSELNKIKNRIKELNPEKVRRDFIDGEKLRDDLSKDASLCNAVENKNHILSKIRAAKLNYDLLEKFNDLKSDVDNLHVLKESLGVLSASDVDIETLLSKNLRKKLSEMNSEPLLAALKSMPDKRGVYTTLSNNEYIKIGEDQFMPLYSYGNERFLGEGRKVKVFFDGQKWDKMNA
ncbi:hypothetical protein [Pantoea stewartii]|uniref:Tox-PLDMTX domain-containing protein n=1 Tax=Pantoea stewartii subsp. stewartii DC283 TaxID=660596 RepID=H3RLU9_PANSE|nr:hypothetical protein [Pantoea stewartii]ARF52071.1 hypothetical protein DSJ_22655 [Pantoea stewartii subsp. stewartii DC283]EHT97636.1 hypothetical protein CKS_5533 [Pantoea stewartii subsp. stewartii DC283]